MWWRGRCGGGLGLREEYSRLRLQHRPPLVGEVGEAGKCAVGSDSGTVGGGAKCTIPVDFPNSVFFC